MLELLAIFQEVEDPRKGNAKRHDLHEMLVVALLSMLTGGRSCVDMEDYGCATEPWLRKFLTLEHGIPSHDHVLAGVRAVGPAGLQTALLRLAQDWADQLGGVVAVDGKALRQSFEAPSASSPLGAVRVLTPCGLRNHCSRRAEHLLPPNVAHPFASRAACSRRTRCYTPPLRPAADPPSATARSPSQWQHEPLSPSL